MPTAPRQSRKDLIRALEGAELYSNEILANLLTTTLVAHFRGGQVSLKDAARACQMSENNFALAIGVVDNEARRMLKAALESQPMATNGP